MCIKAEWIESTILTPDAEYVQSDGRIRKWKRIRDAGDKYLRVVLPEDGEHFRLFVNNIINFTNVTASTLFLDTSNREYMLASH
jgi:hypothetical protein